MVTGSQGRGIHATFPTQTLVQAGDSIKATYTFTTPATVTSVGSEASFKVGMYDPLDRALNADIVASSGAPNSVYGYFATGTPGLPGYMMDHDVGAAGTTAEDLGFRQHNTPVTASTPTGRLMGTNTGFTQISPTGPDGAYTFAPNTTYTGSFTITLLNSGQMRLAGTLGSAGHSVTDTIDVSNGTSYGMLAFWANSAIFGTSSTPNTANNGIDFSNVQIEKIAGLAWSNTGSGDWGNAGNWSGAVVPNGGASALLGSAATANATVNLDTAPTVGILTFDNTAANYTINGSSSNSLTVDASVGSAHVQVLAGSHVINAPVTLVDTTNVHIAAASTLAITDLNASDRRINKSGAGTLSVSHVRADRLDVLGGTVRVEPNGGATGVSVLDTLTIDPSAKLDLTDNDLIIDYDSAGTSPENAIRQHVKNARVTGATSGIFSTPGSPDDDKVLAVADNAAWGKSSFNGANIDASTVVGKYTYFGDANLDGKVTGDDYLNVDANLGTGDTWLEGDFNMNGVTTGDDYLAIDANLGKGTADPLAFAELKEEMVALHVAMFGEEYLVKLAAADAEGFGASVVPEPAGLAITLLLGWTTRRRRA